MNQSKYTVLIRTLGTAGDKYLRTLQAIDCQTVKPEKIYVALPHGYDQPKEGLGNETYLYVQKGMVAQRAFAFTLIESVEWVLLLDDDVEFAPDFVENLLNAGEDNHADAVCPKILSGGGKRSYVHHILNTVTLTRQESDKFPDYFIRISRGGGYIVNSQINKDKVYLTQSGIGICSLCRLEAMKAIHFEQDLWLEKYGYALPEDQVFFYKMNLYGFKVVYTPKYEFVHLDAKSGAVIGRDAVARRARNYRLAGRNFTLFWYLYVYRQVRGWERLKAIGTLGYKMLATTLIYIMRGLVTCQWSCIFAFPKGYWEAFKERRNM